VYNVRC